MPVLMKTLTKSQIEQILFDEENHPNQFGELMWNSNELVFEAYPNIGVAGIAPHMPDKFGEQLAKAYNQLSSNP